MWHFYRSISNLQFRACAFYIICKIYIFANTQRFRNQTTKRALSISNEHYPFRSSIIHFEQASLFVRFLTRIERRITFRNRFYFFSWKTLNTHTNPLHTLASTHTRVIDSLSRFCTQPCDLSTSLVTVSLYESRRWEMAALWFYPTSPSKPSSIISADLQLRGTISILSNVRNCSKMAGARAVSHLHRPFAFRLWCVYVRAAIKNVQLSVLIM